MTSHRAEPPPRYQTHYGRLVILGVSLATTGVALLGGIGVLPSVADDDTRPAAQAATQSAGDTTTEDRAEPETTADEAVDQAADETTDEAADETEPRRRGERAGGRAPDGAVEPELGTDDAGAEAPLPAESGEGERAVFSESEQRVWIVGDDEQVLRTYLVSGSLTDNLDPGTYEVYSRSADAIGIDGSTMQRFVRFTQGPTGAAIGFHDIPVDDGEKVQTRSELGTPLSHGCIRQGAADAKAMWRFAQLGTTVVVTA